MSNGGSSNAPLHPEELDRLKKAAQEQLKSLGVDDQIKSLVAGKRLHPNPIKGKEPDFTPKRAMEQLKGQGVIAQVVKTINLSEIVENSSFSSRRQPLRSLPSLSKRYLHVKIKSGNGLALGSNATISSNDHLLVCGELFGQRFRSAPVPAISAPTFEASALVELPGHATADPSTLLTHRQPLHLVVLHAQHAPAVLTPHIASDTARISTSPSASATASICIAQRSHSWGQWGPSPPGAGSAPIGGHSSSSGSNAGTAASLAPNAAYFLTATSGQQSHQQGPIRPVTPVSTTDLLRMSNRADVVGTCDVDWRQALTNKGEVHCYHVQLISQAHAHSVGMISVDLEVSPALAEPVEPAALRAQTNAEARRDMEAMASFSGRVKEWWQDFSHDALSRRQEGGLRLTCMGEDGLLRPCCGFVKPLQLGRFLATPREAARFVSLLAPKESQETAANRLCSLHTLLESCQATQAEKALLLANLLLGYGLDAWVCFGADAVGQQTWVLTRPSKDAAVFWDPSSGMRHSPSSAGQPKGCPFRSIACVFNQRRLYGNLQAAEGLAAASYVLEDPGRWRELPVHVHDVPGATAMRFDLHMPPFDSAGHEVRLESELKKALSDHRAESLGHAPTTWDDNMAYVLMSSLAGHEQEALTGQLAANHKDFQQCIKRSIPPGCMFKGSSQHHRSLCSSSIMQGMLREPAIRDILATQVTDISFALRVKIFVYPEHVCSVWLMLALKYPTPRSARGIQDT
ncbi:TPA: Centrosomal protein of 76 kDa [Trebouxia sp. C0004]